MKKSEIVVIVLLAVLVPVLLTRMGTFAQHDAADMGTGYERKLESNLPRKSLKKQNLPKNGAVLKRAEEPTVQLTLANGSKRNLYVKFVGSSGKKAAFAGFVRGGKRATFHVPVGSYKVRYAMGGDVWYGSKGCFGSETRYYKDLNTSGGDTETYERNKLYSATVYDTSGVTASGSLREVPPNEF